MPVPIIAPTSQSMAESSRGSGRSNPASVQASTAAMLPKRWLEFIAFSSSGAKYCSANASTSWGTPATWQANLSSASKGM